MSSIYRFFTLDLVVMIATKDDESELHPYNFTKCYCWPVRDDFGMLCQPVSNVPEPFRRLIWDAVHNIVEFNAHVIKHQQRHAVFDPDLHSDLAFTDYKAKTNNHSSRCTFSSHSFRHPTQWQFHPLGNSCGFFHNKARCCPNPQQTCYGPHPGICLSLDISMLSSCSRHNGSFCCSLNPLFSVRREIYREECTCEQ